MTPQQLKNSILQLAIQGKLVEQRPEEGTAKDLLQEISAEKRRLIQEGKIKKAKPLPEISEDEIPFEVPESWEWVRLGDIGALERGSGIKRNETTTQGKPCIRYGELYTTYQTRFDTAVSYTTPEIFSQCHKVCKNDIVMSLTGENKHDIAMAVTYEGDSEIAMGGDMTKWFSHGMDPIYLTYLLNSPYGITCKQKRATGNIIVHISNGKLSEIPLPIPPLAEQHRIVSKIEELLPYIDQYDKAYTKLTAWNKKFPEAIRQSILQYAMEGKLVEQRPEEGTAEELLREIRVEKARLIREGKIKKTKPLPEISEDEIPFEVPESWMWVRLGDILSSLTDGTHKTPKYTVSGIPFISVKNISSRFLSFENTKFISAKEHEELIKRCHPEKGDILLSKVGTTGIPVIIASEQEFSIFVSIALLKFSSHMYAPYLLRAIESPNVQEQCKTHTRGVGNKNWVLNDIANTILPLPPLAEQKRIVTRIEELLSHCNAL